MLKRHLSGKNAGGSKSQDPQPSKKPKNDEVSTSEDVKAHSLLVTADPCRPKEKVLILSTRGITFR
jgi:hypothetical protein